MKTPQGTEALIDDGVIDEVLRPLKSGKEAAVYVVRSGGEVRCAKVATDNPTSVGRQQRGQRRLLDPEG